MRDERLRTIAAAALVLGALLGMAGTIAPTANLRGLAWGVDGTFLVVGTALLAVHHVRQGNELLAAAFLVYMAGETLMVLGSAMDVTAIGPLFAAGAALWSAGLALASASDIMPWFVRVTGTIGSMLFAVCALRMFGGAALTPLSRPLPFLAYPFLSATLIGWGVVRYQEPAASRQGKGRARRALDEVEA
jgi:hypothetical protein